ncbi:MAG: phosphatase PAP2 family protein [Cyanobacteria bacterium SIG32]|nr:phosphatase PAP2 family protein [Cyanobacteria bacterium SIG32]
MKENSVVVNWNYVTLSLIIFALFTVAVLYMPGLREIDTEILKAIRKFLGQFPNYIPVFFSNYGGVGNFWWPQIAAGSVLVSHRKFLKAFLLIFFTQGSYILIDVIKNLICRERPGLNIYSGYSFPSGHTTITMCFYGIIIYLIMTHTRSQFWRIFLSVFFGFMIFMVAISRLWLGVHFPTDVLAGLFLGFLFVNLFIILDKFFAAR